MWMNKTCDIRVVGRGGGGAGVVGGRKQESEILAGQLRFCSTSSVLGELVDELLMEVAELCCQPYAHHVIQSILEHGQERHKHIVALTLIADVVRLAQHKSLAQQGDGVLCLSLCGAAKMDSGIM